MTSQSLSPAVCEVGCSDLSVPPGSCLFLASFIEEMLARFTFHQSILACLSRRQTCLGQ